MLQKLSEYRILFENSLNDYYSKQEINSFFYLFCEHKLGFSRTEVALNTSYILSEKQILDTQDTINRLQKFEPIQYINGVTSFFGLRFKVNQNVLIPRPETEELVELIIKKNGAKPVKILDIGTGSGCIAISLSKNILNSEVWALDISEKAIALAKENAALNEVQINFIQADILSTHLLDEDFDLIVSNPPYVSIKEKAEMQKNVLEYEPRIALFVSDENPLVFYQKITELALKNLKKDGFLAFEINQYYGNETQKLIREIGFREVNLIKDFLGNNRFIFAKRND